MMMIQKKHKPVLLTHNYHMHTARCGHAIGTDRQYIEQSIQAGYETVGFSDHTPYPFTNGYRSRTRMACKQLDDYVESVLRLQRTYRSDLRILLGLEVEYYPEFFSEWKQLTAAYPFDYFLLGQHFVGNEYEGVYSGNETADPDILHRYVDQTIEAMQTGIFLYLAHPDLIRYRDTDSELYEAEMRRLCEAAKAVSLPLELNLLGIRDHRWYPNENFWRIVGEVGNDVVLGADAHRPKDVYSIEAMETALRMIQQYKLNWKQNLL